jgi:hypothetical protein
MKVLKGFKMGSHLRGVFTISERVAFGCLKARIANPSVQKFKD